jgi:hypothetical protein
MRRLITALLAAAALSAPAVAGQRPDPDAALAKLLDGRVAGKPTSCLPVSFVDQSQIVDGRAIVYRSGGTLWVNRPQSGAESLRDDDVLVTRIYGSQLCRIDTVNLVDRYSRFQRGFVVLGDFVPYRRPKQG